MDNLSNKEIRDLWAEHFPKRHGDRQSLALLEELVLNVLERAHEGETYYTLAALGIPKREFDQLRSEQALSESERLHN
jgi:hypothetical protein